MGDRVKKAGELVALLVGLAALSFVVGFMVGGSSTPVVSVALPALVALIPIGLDALKRKADKDWREQAIRLLEKDPGTAEKGKLEAALAEKPEAMSSPGRLGAALLAVSAGCFVGSVVGGLARVREWYRAPSPGVMAPLPWDGAGWEGKDCTLTPETMIGFINIRNDLLAVGYSSAQVERMFELTRDHWCVPEAKIAAPTPPSPMPWENARPNAKPCPINKHGALEFVALREQLVRHGYDESVADRIYALSPNDWCGDATSTALVLAPPPAGPAPAASTVATESAAPPGGGTPAGESSGSSGSTGTGPGVRIVIPTTTTGGFSPFAKTGGPADPEFKYQANALREWAKETQGLEQ
jgi:hypothetical protein